MKSLLLIGIALLIVGGIYHEEVSDYVADLTSGSGGSGSVTSIADSASDMGRSGNNLMRGIGGRLGR